MGVSKKNVEEAPKKKIGWKWRTFKYVVAPIIMLSAASMYSASYGSQHPDHWYVKSSRVAVGYAEDAGRYVLDKVGLSSEDNPAGGIEQKVDKDKD